jgi:hypothetical protein
MSDDYQARLKRLGEHNASDAAKAELAQAAEAKQERAKSEAFRLWIGASPLLQQAVHEFNKDVAVYGFRFELKPDDNAKPALARWNMRLRKGGGSVGGNMIFNVSAFGVVSFTPSSTFGLADGATLQTFTPEMMKDALLTAVEKHRAEDPRLN